MKKTKKAWLFLGLQLLFMIVVPIAFIWMQYGVFSLKYKISVTSILLMLLMFLIFKKIFINNWLKSIDQKIINIETNCLSLTDKTAIDANKKSWQTYSLIQLFFSSIIPLLILIIAILTIKVVEDGLIKLYGVLMFCAISIIVGLLFKVLEIFSTKTKNEED